jgi:CheY-like chemotaxis protein/HPt (histidine-containing phosphotransfer) domain-containing protein
MEMVLFMDSVADSQSDMEKTPSARILVVDDDTLNQRMMQLLLRRDGHVVDVVSSGLEAIDAVKRQKYDVVFMDLQMPVMDGVETSRRIREWENGGQHTFIVAVTASYLPEKGQELFEAGIDNYVSKPFELEHIQRLLKYSLSARSTAIIPVESAVQYEVPAEAVLDIRKGIKQVGGDVEAYRELLSDFIGDLPGRLQMIQDTFARKDLVSLARAAHNLNGIAASLGASQLSQYAQKLDKQSVEGYTEALDHLIGEIKLTGNRLMETSNSFLADGNITVRSL